jgi:hypothetical protein
MDSKPSDRREIPEGWMQSDPISDCSRATFHHGVRWCQPMLSGARYSPFS